MKEGIGYRNYQFISEVSLLPFGEKTKTNPLKIRSCPMPPDGPSKRLLSTLTIQISGVV